MKTSLRLTICTFLCSIISLSAQNTKEITGYVTHFGEALKGVEITTVDQEKVITTDAKGYYRIEAAEGNTVTYTYPGMEVVEIIIEDVTEVLNISMNLTINVLKEVVVTEQRLSRKDKLEIQWKQGEGVVKTAYGFLDKKRSPWSVSFIEEEDILRSFDLLDIIRRVAPQAGMVFDNLGLPVGISISPRFCGLGGCAAAGFDIDGFLTANTRIPFIPLDQIKRIAVIKSPVFGIYGRFGGAGMIVINTKTGVFVKDGNNGDPYDYAKLRNNIYTDDAEQYGWNKGNKSNYVSTLEKTASTKQVMELYAENSNLYGHREDFHFDTATFLLRKYNDKENGLAVLRNVIENFDDNPNTLKAVAYLLEDSGNLADANKVYEQILKLRPSHAQSYRDLANSYLAVGEEKKAMGMYARYERHFVQGQGVKGSEIDSIINVEKNNMVFQGKSEIFSKYKELNNTNEWPVRILLEWNNSEAEFDFQLVHPEKQYYTWSHTMEKNKDFIKDGKVMGFSSKQFYIDADSKGTWSANLTYLGNKSFKNSYLKATVYYNYSTYKERKEVFVFKLDAKNVNQTLFTMQAPARANISLKQDFIKSKG